MRIGHVVAMGVLGVLLLGMVVAGPSPASAANMYYQQALLLVHLPLGNGQTFTTNYTFAATEGSNTTVNVKCFNDALQRIGPAVGVNVQLNNTGQIAQHTPTSLLVTTDPLFSGTGWCWANNTSANVNDFNAQITIGATTDLTPGGILNSATSTLIGTDSGLAEIATALGGIPYFTTNGGTVNFLVIVNPLTTTIPLTLQLFDATGTKQGADLNRTFSGRSLQVLSIPGVFGVTPTPPTSGSVRITTNANGFLGWLVMAQQSTGRVQFTAVGLDADNVLSLPAAFAP